MRLIVLVFAFRFLLLRIVSPFKTAEPSTCHSQHKVGVRRETAKRPSSSVEQDGDGEGWKLKIAIAGAGPSGLLLAHRLIASGLPLEQLDVFESRADPRSSSSSLEGRAYALGLGIRGRTAIKTVDGELWSSVKARGYECERFRLHLSKKISLQLRGRDDGVHPSVLIYQSDLCSALLDELERRAKALETALNVRFNSNIAMANLETSTLSFVSGGVTQESKKYDLLVGCDGANSIVRESIKVYSPPDTFECTKRELLPGCFKVARITSMPPALDADSVALILPKTKSLGITAFVEPTVDGGGCVLFAGRLNSESTSSTDSAELGTILYPDPSIGGREQSSMSDEEVEMIRRLLVEEFPLDGTAGLDDAVRQLLRQRTSVASSVRCNTYNSKSGLTAAAICGDAAHATGGVSGQGANSALVDVATLADCLVKHYQPDDSYSPEAKESMLHQSVLAYSMKAVPEGRALYDLSFGNDGRTLPIFRNLRNLLSTAIDGVFGGRFGIGKKPLQTLLASSLDSFVTIRRSRERYYIDPFPSNEEIESDLNYLYSKLP